MEMDKDAQTVKRCNEVRRRPKRARIHLRVQLLLVWSVPVFAHAFRTRGACTRDAHKGRAHADRTQQRRCIGSNWRLVTTFAPRAIRDNVCPRDACAKLGHGRGRCAVPRLHEQDAGGRRQRGKAWGADDAPIAPLGHRQRRAARAVPGHSGDASRPTHWIDTTRRWRRRETARRHHSCRRLWRRWTSLRARRVVPPPAPNASLISWYYRGLVVAHRRALRACDAALAALVPSFLFPVFPVLAYTHTSCELQM